jgi:hypothetical protein
VMPYSPAVAALENAAANRMPSIEARQCIDVLTI